MQSPLGGVEKYIKTAELRSRAYRVATGPLSHGIYRLEIKSLTGVAKLIRQSWYNSVNVSSIEF